MSTKVLFSAGALCIGVLAANVADAAISVSATNVLATTSAGASPDSSTGNFRDSIVRNRTGSLDDGTPTDTTTNLTSRSPYPGNPIDPYKTGTYHSVQGGGTATYLFTGGATLFNIIWGSPDQYNTVEFFDSSDALIGPAIRGDNTTVRSVSSYTTVGGAPAGYSNVTFTSTDPFYKVILSSEVQNALEFAVVPLPGALALLLSALAGLGWFKRRELFEANEKLATA